MTRLIFGYGSLVHPDTRPEVLQAEPATLSGWTRTWAHRTSMGGQRTSVLSVRPEAPRTIAGVLMHVPESYFPALEQREAGYTRVPVTVTCNGREIPCETYVGNPDRAHAPEPDAPIWRSYLDCVLAGFFRLGGASAVGDFIQTTDDWGPILDDASVPYYLRAVTLTQEESEAIANVLDAHHLRDWLFEGP